MITVDLYTIQQIFKEPEGTLFATQEHKVKVIQGVLCVYVLGDWIKCVASEHWAISLYKKIELAKEESNDCKRRTETENSKRRTETDI